MQKSLVGDAFAEYLQQCVMVEIIEETLDVSFNPPPYSYHIFDLAECSMTASIWSKAVWGIRESWFIDSFEYVFDDSLQQFILETGDAQRSHFSIRFLDINPSNWCGFIGWGFEFSDFVFDERHTYTIYCFSVSARCHISRLGATVQGCTASGRVYRTWLLVSEPSCWVS